MKNGDDTVITVDRKLISANDWHIIRFALGALSDTRKVLDNLMIEYTIKSYNSDIEYIGKVVKKLFYWVK